MVTDIALNTAAVTAIIAVLVGVYLYDRDPDRRRRALRLLRILRGRR